MSRKLLPAENGRRGRTSGVPESDPLWARDRILGTARRSVDHGVLADV
jgi:hypothetical protein